MSTGPSGHHAVDVIVCGGGPTGLSLAYLLGRAGLRVALFERRPGTTPLPKGQAVQAFTGELFRRWGVWDQLAQAGWSTERSNGQGFYVRVANGPVAAVPVAPTGHADYVRKWEALSPAYPRKVPASDYEAALHRAAQQWPQVGLHFSTRVVDVETSGSGVRVTVEESDSGAERRFDARYLVACDGAHSLVRRLAGSGQDQGPTFGNQVLAEFRANLDATLGRDGFFHSFILDPRYAGWFGSRHPQSGLWRYSFRHDEETPPPEAVVRERILGALGMPQLPIEIVRILRFDYTTGLLRRWREGRILFAGDAAHWHSPWGGLGMNSGVQDANNLAWKLALVLQGRAADRLLDSYEAERKPRALLTVKAATYNALNYQAIVESLRVGDQQAIAQGRLSPEGVAFLHERLVTHSENSILHTGYQLGTAYRSHAVVEDGSLPPPATLASYVESAVPGVRAPHAWVLAQDGRRVPITDLWGAGFTLVALGHGPAWARACAEAADRCGIEVKLLDVGAGGDWLPADGKLARLYGDRGSEAILVRPDGHVAARLPAQRGDEGPALLGVLEQLLGLAQAAATADT